VADEQSRWLATLADVLHQSNIRVPGLLSEREPTPAGRAVQTNVRHLHARERRKVLAEQLAFGVAELRHITGAGGAVGDAAVVVALLPRHRHATQVKTSEETGLGRAVFRRRGSLAGRDVLEAVGDVLDEPRGKVFVNPRVIERHLAATAALHPRPRRVRARAVDLEHCDLSRCRLLRLLRNTCCCCATATVLLLFFLADERCWRRSCSSISPVAIPAARAGAQCAASTASGAAGLPTGRLAWTGW